MVFSCRQVIFSKVFSIREPATAAAKVCAAATAILLLLWVSEVTLGIFGVQFWGFSVLQRHGVFLPCFPSGSQQQQQQKSDTSTTILWVSEVTLGIFGVQFWSFFVLQRHGVFLPAGDFFHGGFHPGASSSSKSLCSSRRKR